MRTVRTTVFVWMENVIANLVGRALPVMKPTRPEDCVQRAKSAPNKEHGMQLTDYVDVNKGGRDTPVKQVSFLIWANQ